MMAPNGAADALRAIGTAVADDLARASRVTDVETSATVREIRDHLGSLA